MHATKLLYLCLIIAIVISETHGMSLFSASGRTAMANADKDISSYRRSLHMKFPRPPAVMYHDQEKTTQDETKNVPNLPLLRSRPIDSLKSQVSKLHLSTRSGFLCLYGCDEKEDENNDRLILKLKLLMGLKGLRRSKYRQETK